VIPFCAACLTKKPVDVENSVYLSNHPLHEGGKREKLLVSFTSFTEMTLGLIANAA